MYVNYTVKVKMKNAIEQIGYFIELPDEEGNFKPHLQWLVPVSTGFSVIYKEITDISNIKRYIGYNDIYNEPIYEDDILTIHDDDFALASIYFVKSLSLDKYSELLAKTVNTNYLTVRVKMDVLFVEDTSLGPYMLAPFPLNKCRLVKNIKQSREEEVK